MDENFIKKILVVIALLFLCIIPMNQILAESTTHNKVSSFSQDSNFPDRFNIDSLIKFAMKISRSPSISACIVKGDTIVWYGGYGLSNIETKTPPTKDTIYMIASISKTITATAILQLYEKGTFNLDDNVNDFLDFKLYHPMYPNETITFRMLLSHSSGMNTEPDYYHMIDYHSDPLPLKSWLKGYFYDANNTMKSSVWTQNKPGEQLHYVNIDFCVLAYIVEQITGQSFNEYCREYIFLPLEMYNTSFLLSDINKNTMAIPYIIEDHSLYSFLKEYYFPLDFYSWRMYPAGNIMTSIEELSHFLIAHMNKGKYKDTQLLNASTIEIMHAIHSPTSYKGLYYGFGFWIYPTYDQKVKYFGHPGAIYGYDSLMKTRCKDNVSIIYFINRNINREITGKISHVLITNDLFFKACVSRGE